MRTRPLERPVAPAATKRFSRIITLTPRSERWKARLAPCTPAPMTMTSAVLFMSAKALCPLAVGAVRVLEHANADLNALALEHQVTMFELAELLAGSRVGGIADQDLPCR